MRVNCQLRLADVLDDASESPIDIGLIISIGESDDGVVIRDKNGSTRVVVENYQGKLLTHVWETPDSIDNDPTHSIEIEV